MAWKDTLKHYNPFSLFLLSGVTIVGLAAVNEWIVDKAGTALSGTKSKAFDSMVERKLPTYKPEYIERWEKEYGNKK
ncbi:hypothetical protein C9374_006122 [Naegleria lovaniensis]|uniref:Uncharacterized protein n=1 Tax=Naegleria lovaniensis TaxID=51637 RepID=A0AA88KJE0_NAELO|nr:uncharacterized protein C9374_006122 [Naegleria lovaniensis]KAG2381738.1 hypothetical protein C9374_006122 [Naegleria lovaniensis]